MLSGIHERGINKDENIKVKIRKYPCASSINILDHIKPSLGKAPEQIIIHAGTNDTSNNTNYLKNVKKIVKLVNETCKDTKLSFSVICRTDIKDITDTTNTTISHLENYCKKQSVGFIDNGNIKKSGLNSKGPHLHQKLEYFLSSITDLLDHYLETYEDFIVIGDFNETETSPALDSFLHEQKCKNIKNKTCFKLVKGSCIDLILTSRLSLHQFTNVFETGISDYHLLIYTMLKSTYTKMEPKFLSRRKVCGSL